MTEHEQVGWVRYNELTGCYETKDRTSVSAELVDNVQCLADIFYISSIRENQRKAMND
jgi:hypothetical protein